MPISIAESETTGPAINFAAITTASSGDQTIIAAVTGKAIVVLNYVLNNSAATAQTVTWKSGSTAISGAITSPASSLQSSYSVGVSGGPYPVLATNAGEALVLTLSASTQVSGHLAYYVV